MANNYCKTSQLSQNTIRSSIEPCSDFIPWQPNPESMLFLNAQPPSLLKTLGRSIPLNISFFQFNSPGLTKTPHNARI